MSNSNKYRFPSSDLMEYLLEAASLLSRVHVFLHTLSIYLGGQSFTPKEFVDIFSDSHLRLSAEMVHCNGGCSCSDENSNCLSDYELFLIFHRGICASIVVSIICINDPQFVIEVKRIAIPRGVDISKPQALKLDLFKHIIKP